jgi:serine/threonine protein kinase
LTPVARALERAHNFTGPDGPLSIVHRDLKPENIFIAQVAGEELVKILDFGIGKVKSAANQMAGPISQESSTPLAFTPAYGAPEQWAPRHYGQTGPWTDVWGLALCLVGAMLGRAVIEGEPAMMMSIALDPKRRPTPRNEGIDLPDAIEAVFARALSLDPRARQRHAGIFWNELVAALEQAATIAQPRVLELAEDLEFDPSSVRKPAASVRVSAPYGVQLAAPARASQAPTAAALPTGLPGTTRRAAVSAPHFVPDLELAPPSVSRRPSGERPIAPPVPADPSLLDLDSVSMPNAVALDLDLPADEPRAQRSVSSQSFTAVRPSEPRSSHPPPRRLSGAMTAVREPQPGLPVSGMMPTRSSTPDLQSAAAEPPRSAQNSLPPPSADVSAPFPASFVAKIDRKLLEERSLAQRLRTASVLLVAAILVAIFDPIYAEAAGEQLKVFGLRSSVFAGALLLLALGLAAREVTRER